MEMAMRCFESAKARGEQYMVILQKKQKNAESLTFAVTGNWGEVQMARINFKRYSTVAVLNTEQAWEDARAYLEAVQFVW